MTAIIAAAAGMAALLYFSGAFSGSETAYFSLSRLELGQMDEESRIRKLMRDPDRLLIAILLGNTLVNVAAGSLGALIALRIGRGMGYPESAIIAIEVGVITFVILIAGEIAPKMYAMQRNLLFAQRTAGLLTSLMRAFGPAIDALQALFEKLSGGASARERPFVTSEELRTIIALSEERGTLEEDERDMIDSVMEFGETTVRELMVPRVDMDALEDTMAVGAAIEKVRELGFSRFPVYHEDIDHVTGVLYAKDLLRFDETEQERPIGGLTRPVTYTPESKRAGELLRELQRDRVHIAIVVDEYGGTAGLVTMEDLIEEIVGEIRDEHDTEEPLVQVVNRSTVIADGTIRLDELEEEHDIALHEEEVETLGGYLMNSFGRIPSVGEKLERDGFEFTVEEVEEQRITRVRIVRTEDDDETEEPS
jgi:putative hemolysin